MQTRVRSAGSSLQELRLYDRFNFLAYVPTPAARHPIKRLYDPAVDQAGKRRGGGSGFLLSPWRESPPSPSPVNLANLSRERRNCDRLADKRVKRTVTSEALKSVGLAPKDVHLEPAGNIARQEALEDSAGQKIQFTYSALLDYRLYGP